MTNELNKINTEVFNIATGEIINTPSLSLQVSALLTMHNLKEAKLELQKTFKESRIEITLQNYQYAKKNMASLNKLKDAIDILIKEKIEIPETTLKEIKAEAKELAKIITEEREFYKTGYEEVYGLEMRKKIKQLVLNEISALYNEVNLEQEYKIITEEQINKLCIISNGGFPQEQEGDFESVYLTGKCKKDILALFHNCLQFKKQRINRIQALEIANLKAGLEELHRITLEDIKPFLDAVDAEFDNKLIQVVQKAIKKQDDIKQAEAKKLAEERAKIEREAKQKEEEMRKQIEMEAKIKAEAEAKIRIQTEQALKAEAEKKLAEERAKIEILEKEKIDSKAKTEILTPKAIDAVNIIRYEVVCSYEVDVEDKGGNEIDEIRHRHVSQGFKSVKFIKKS